METSGNFFPMDMSGMPMQAEQNAVPANGVPQAGQSLNQQSAGGQPSMFGQDVYMSVSISKAVDTIPDS